MGKRAIVFAGQGAQAVGMGKDLAEACPECGEIFKKADEVLGYSLSKICFEGPVEELTRSNHCQPAIFVVSTACHKALTVKSGNPGFAATAGLSLGEWSALHAAGSLSFEDTLRILEARGRFMQEACEEQAGGMISLIGLDPAKIGEICAQAGVHAANFNSADQTVLSGKKDGIAVAEKLAKEAGAKRAIVLNVAGAFHSPLMDSAAKRLDEFLAKVDFREPAIPVVSNVTGVPHGSVADIRRDMVRQVNSPVKWLSCVEWFMKNGTTDYVECGPGKVLGGLIRRIDKEAKLYSISDVSGLEQTAAALSAG